MGGTYDPTVGYAGFDQVDQAALAINVEIVKTITQKNMIRESPGRTLVTGCGEGSEAVLVHRIFGGDTVGVDIGIHEPRSFAEGSLVLMPGDLRCLPFPDRSFDLIYSYHVLEHVADPDAVLREMSRVLKDDGVVFVGFPNKHRAVAYVGTHTGETFFQKIVWNLNDYRDRLMGRFENEKGAHAGFAQRPFVRRCKGLFSIVIPVRDEYMSLKYHRLAPVIRFLSRTGLAEFAFPSNYFILRSPSRVDRNDQQL